MFKLFLLTLSNQKSKVFNSPSAKVHQITLDSKQVCCVGYLLSKATKHTTKHTKRNKFETGLT